MNDALISPCGTYRYTLGRAIESTSTAHKPCLFVLFNPSTADAQVPDPTLTRCVGFASDWGCTQLTLVNLFAFRTAYPSDLRAAFKAGADIKGPENDLHVDRELRRHNPDLGHLIVAAWGAHPMAKLAPKIQERLRSIGALCLGTNNNGSPKHPLYLRADTELIKWAAT